MFTKKRVIIISTIAIIILIVVSISLKGNKIDYVTAQVDYGTIQQSVDVTGSIESSQAIDLNFKTSGRLQSLNVSAGDQVVAGQVLATLEAGALQSRVTDAQSALLEAQANHDKLLSGATSEDVQISQINVDQKHQAYTTAENNLTNLKLQAETELRNLKNTAIITLGNEIIDGGSALETIKNTLNSEDAEDTLGILDMNSLTLAEASRSLAINSVADAELAVSAVFEYSPDQQVLDTLDQVVSALKDVRDCLNDVFNVLENTIVSTDLTQTELDALTAGIQAEQATISTARTNLQTVESNWTNKQIYYQDQISRAEDSLQSAQDNLRLAEAQLALKQADPQSYEITASQARVTKAQASLSLALANLGDTIIRAPVAGVITKVNQKIGEQTSLAQPVVAMIGESALEIEVNIPESDISKIKVGQVVEITLDSFGDEVIFPGAVTFINPAETIIQDVVYYEVKVQFTNSSEDIKPGMTANVVIVTSIKEDVLRLPLRALKQKNGDRYVEILVNDELQEKIIMTGLRGDDYIEILEGLSESDEVITYVKNGN